MISSLRSYFSDAGSSNWPVFKNSTCGVLASSFGFVKAEKRNLPRILCGETSKSGVFAGVRVRMDGGEGRKIMILILQERERIWG